jgi:hypothetical protein
VFYNDYLTVTTDGQTVTARTLVSASRSVTVSSLKVQIVGGNGSLDFPSKRNVVMPAWVDLEQEFTRTLPPGKYTARLRVQHNGTWYGFEGPTVTFTVAATPPVVEPPATGTIPPVKAGFRRVLAEHFDTPAPVGGVAKHGGDDTLPYSKVIEPYGEGWQDNYGGIYRFDAGASVADSVLRVAVGSPGGVNTGAAWSYLNPETGWGFTYGAVEQRVRVVGDLSGFGSASLLWPDSDQWGDGEIDFPEGNFGGTVTAYHHGLGDRAPVNEDIFTTDARWADWHTYRIEWTPGGTSYFVDGQRIGTNTSATPTTGHHWVTQIGRHGSPVPTDRAGVYEVDWVTIDLLS